ncbi:MAG: hypothetical protein L0Y68_02005, partial [Candidatus Dadabacteria bacterium]|nr:hypothetical protein [Candidatus Dadabacteria bacterium]
SQRSRVRIPHRPPMISGTYGCMNTSLVMVYLQVHSNATSIVNEHLYKAKWQNCEIPDVHGIISTT